MFHFIDDHSVHRLQSTSSVVLLLLRVSYKSKQWKQKNKKYFNFSFSYRAVYAYCTKLGKCSLRKFTYNSLTYVYNTIMWGGIVFESRSSVLAQFWMYFQCKNQPFHITWRRIWERWYFHPFLPGLVLPLSPSIFNF